MLIGIKLSGSVDVFVLLKGTSLNMGNKLRQLVNITKNSSIVVLINKVSSCSCCSRMQLQHFLLLLNLNDSSTQKTNVDLFMTTCSIMSRSFYRIAFFKDKFKNRIDPKVDNICKLQYFWDWMLPWTLENTEIHLKYFYRKINRSD